MFPKSLLIGFLSTVFISAPAAAAEGVDGARISIASGPEVVANGDEKKCPGKDETSQDTDVPDAPPRFIKNEDGSVLGFAAHYTNLLYVGRSANSIKRRNCIPAFQAGINSDPQKFADHEWLVSPVVLSGGRIYSLVHNEYQGARYNAECRGRLPPGAPLWYPVCIYGALTGAISEDGGKSFKKIEGPLQVVAAPPSKFRTDSRWYGVHDPSNIVLSPKDGYYYFTANSPKFAEMEEGVCVFRTKDPLNAPWLAWDGSEFALRMESAYSREAQTSKSCKPVFKHAISGITFNTVLNKYIGVGGEERGGVYYSVSDDLLNWSEPTKLLDSKPMYVWKQEKNPPTFYYSLIDPDSPSTNFGTSGKNLYLYLVQWRVAGGKMLSRERDIVRYSLALKK